MKFSIIMPTFNNMNVIRRSVDSIIVTFYKAFKKLKGIFKKRRFK